MMRPLLFAAALALAASARAGEPMSAAADTDAAAPVEAPQSAAIRLVMVQRADELRRLDPPEGALFDTKVRTWTAKRPVAPGVLDSRHYFEVTYAIDGEVLARWAVNTRHGLVGGAGERVPID
jgi:hypothetical protein